MGTFNRIMLGARFGKRVVIAKHPSGTAKHPKYLVRCDCGAETIITAGTFHASQGCRECSASGQPRKYGNRVIAGNLLYLRWCQMRHRCRPKGTKKTAHWGDRGISVCQEWQTFGSFETWALNRGYKHGMSLDRIDVDGDYEPANCEWVTRSVNSKRARAEYKVWRKGKLPRLPIFYDEPCFGDF